MPNIDDKTMWDAGQPDDGRFPTTQWSLVDRAGRDDAQARRQALGKLVTRYLPALRAHLVYGKRLSPDDADDLLQEFLVGKVLERDLIARANRDLGRFRTFLLTALDRFRIDRLRRDHARRRAPGGARVDLDRGPDALPASTSDAFDVAWARRVIDESLARMRAECEASGRPEVWAVFQCRLLDPITEGCEPVGYETLIERFGFRSPSQASNVLITAKRAFARALRSVVGEYTRDQAEVELEIHELIDTLGRAGR
jgi:RNA polymerase sigma-70 factor (ECF subfamily)